MNQSKINFSNSLIISIALLSTIIFWYFLYNSYTLEYDENANNLAYSFPMSIITVICLKFYSRIHTIKSIFNNIIFYLIFIFGTPITYLLIITYFLTFKMNYESTTYSNISNTSFEITKFKNILKSENTLIIKHFNKIDTIKVIVSSNEKIKNVFKIKNGKELNISLKSLNYLPKNKFEEISKY